MKTANLKTIRASEILSLPHTALTGVEFAEEEDSWRDNAWEVVRILGSAGGMAVELCGTDVVATSSRWDGYRRVVAG